VQIDGQRLLQSTVYFSLEYNYIPRVRVIGVARILSEGCTFWLLQSCSGWGALRVLGVHLRIFPVNYAW